MKRTDIERLKALCKRKKINVKEVVPGGKLFYLKEKDPWDGVEFAEFNNDLSGIERKGLIIRIDSEKNKGTCIHYFTYVVKGEKRFAHISYFTPSTEQAYFEQLKKEAFERFGKKNTGDRFEINNSANQIPTHCGLSRYYKYEKDTDSLYYIGVLLYQSGQWATKLPERVEVTPDLYYDRLSHSKGHHVFAFKVKNLSDGYSVAEANQFLAKQFECYLNKDCLCNGSGFIKLHGVTMYCSCQNQK